MPTVVSAVELNRHSGDLLARIRFNGDQFVIERRGEPIAALISYKVYQALLPILEKMQDLLDAQAAHEDWLAGKGQSFEEFLAELEADEAAGVLSS
ncbi:MAG: type II toxin-antitoxin system Phd/YefM family antitoxin [Anaerolineae bacterium]